jgi:HSP20 family protein
MDISVSQKLDSLWDTGAPFAEAREGKTPSDPNTAGLAPFPDWRPPVDIAESDSEFVIRVEMIGSKPDQLRVILDGNILSIAGLRERQRNEGRQASQRIETDYESFRQNFSVPESTMREKVRAGYRNGILTVHLPKDPAGRIRSVQIDCERL